MKSPGGFWALGSVTLVLPSLAVIAALALAACGGSGSTAASLQSATTTSPLASPSPVIAQDPISQWDAPGTASLAQTQAVARRYAAALSAEKIPKAGLYAPGATSDIHSSEDHVQGAAAIENVYRDGGAAWWGWSKRHHILAAPGVAVYEGVFKDSLSEYATPDLVLLAVDGDKVTHEEVFLQDGTSTMRRRVTCCSSAPGPRDTATVAAQVGAAVGEAFATRDRSALHALVAPDILFRDTSQPQGVRGRNAVLAWLARVPTVKIEVKKPIAGPGWAVLRWTVRRFYSSTGFFSMGIEVADPGATVMEVRGGKVARMTLYYWSSWKSLQTG
jgi:hypothetical protein